MLFLICIEIGFAANAFQFLLPPTLFSLVSGVHEFGAQCAAVGCAQCIEQFAQGHGVFTEEGVAGVEHSFLVGIGETIKRRIEFRYVGALSALQGVEIGPALAYISVSRNKLLCSRTLAAHFGIGAGHDDFGTTLLCAFGKSIDDG